MLGRASRYITEEGKTCLACKEKGHSIWECKGSP